MTFDEAVRAATHAFKRLEDDIVLGFVPIDGSVRVLPWPTTPRGWREAPLYRRQIPEDGWQHPVECTCQICSASAGAEESRS